MLLSMENGEALYGAFHAMILYLSGQPRRDGWLTEDGTESGDPITPEYLASQIKFTVATTKKMLTVVTNDIGWLINHSSKEQREGVAYPDKRVDIRFIVLAKKFHRTQAKNNPYEAELQKENISMTTLLGAKHLEAFHLEHEWPEQLIEDLLEWIPDNPFWCYQIRSLASINRISRSNKHHKFDNALAQMRSEAEDNLLDGDQLEQDMDRRGLGTNDYKQVKNPRTGEMLWRRKI